MDSASYQLLITDTASQSLLLADGNKGGIIAELAYPAQCTPTGLSLAADRQTAYLPATEDAGRRGALFSLNLSAPAIERLPMDLPPPAQFALSPDGSTVYLADPGGILYNFTLDTNSLVAWGRSEQAICVGLAAGKDFVYSAWEHAGGGSLALFTPRGEFVAEYHIEGIPTNITLGEDGRIFVPFTAAADKEREGVAIFGDRQHNIQPSIIDIRPPIPRAGQKVYPCYLAFAPDQRTAYIVNEDSCYITVVDIHTHSIEGHLPIGRSLSSLHLLPDGRFAIGTSQTLAGLSLIDLVSGRLLAVTATERGIINQAVVIPCPSDNPPGSRPPAGRDEKPVICGRDDGTET